MQLMPYRSVLHMNSFEFIAPYKVLWHWNCIGRDKIDNEIDMLCNQGVGNMCAQQINMLAGIGRHIKPRT